MPVMRSAKLYLIYSLFFSLFRIIGHFEKSDFPMGTIIDKNIINKNVIKETPRYIGNKNINDSTVVNKK
jgi:hypothetical protein